ncbi:hypothetical protein EVAR_27702_1 [Eumeta japonica]|uniref:Uncharacterized protein n=1 Tax=Eumeta variegata TaxID=151549 RepID=A0A4C1WR17_EUMVA|nr:hypothetical protein EVAR_27702_1 [Eumeta japonica]
MRDGVLLRGRAAYADRVFVLQKRAVSAIYDLGSRASLKIIGLWYPKNFNVLNVNVYHDSLNNDQDSFEPTVINNG